MCIKDAELCFHSGDELDTIFVIEDYHVKASLEYDRRSMVIYRLFTPWGEYSTNCDCGDSTLGKRLFDDVASQIKLLKGRERLLSIREFDEMAADAISCYNVDNS